MKATRRSIRARHLATILAALDRAEASPHPSVPQLVGSSIIEHGGSAERFLCYGRYWLPEEVRAVVLAYAAAAPDGELADLASQARRERAWVEWYDTSGADEGDMLQDEQLLLPEREFRKAEAARMVAFS